MNWLRKLLGRPQKTKVMVYYGGEWTSGRIIPMCGGDLVETKYNIQTFSYYSKNNNIRFFTNPNKEHSCDV